MIIIGPQCSMIIFLVEQNGVVRGLELAVDERGVGLSHQLLFIVPG